MQFLGAQIGIIFNENTILESEKWKEAEKYVHLTSNGWYFKGDNELEIVGGPLLKNGDDTYRINSRLQQNTQLQVSLQQLKIIRKEKKEKKQHSLTPKPPRKSLRSRSQSIGYVLLNSFKTNTRRIHKVKRKIIYSICTVIAG